MFHSMSQYVMLILASYRTVFFGLACCSFCEGERRQMMTELEELKRDVSTKQLQAHPTVWTSVFPSHEVFRLPGMRNWSGFGWCSRPKRCIHTKEVCVSYPPLQEASGLTGPTRRLGSSFPAALTQVDDSSLRWMLKKLGHEFCCTFVA